MYGLPPFAPKNFVLNSNSYFAIQNFCLEDGMMRHENSSQAHGLEVNAYDDGLHFAYNKDALPEVLNAEFYEGRLTRKFSELPAREERPRRLQGTTLRLSVALVFHVAFAIVAAALAATMANELFEVKSYISLNLDQT